LLRPKLESQIRTLKLTQHVHLLGPKTQLEVRELYRSSDLYVLPCVVGADGNREGLPVSIVEALASGLPVITTPVTGIPEAVQDGYNGILVPEGDSERLADAMETAIRNSEVYESLRLNARPSVEVSFDQDRTMEELRELLEAA
jgi:glycosyltransferase involved in cell wall biosynthesis